MSKSTETDNNNEFTQEENAQESQKDTSDSYEKFYNFVKSQVDLDSRSLTKKYEHCSGYSVKINSEYNDSGKEAKVYYNDKNILLHLNICNAGEDSNYDVDHLGGSADPFVPEAYSA